MPEKKAEKAIVIRICIIIPIIVSELAYRISSGAICNSFCTVCWCCIFYSENTCVIINLIFCHLLVGFKSITGNDFVFLFNADKFVRIDPFLFFIPKEQVCVKFVASLAADMGIDRSYLSPAEPWRDESRDEMLRMTLRVEGKPDYTLVLPADEEYLDAVKNYLDIDVFTDAMLCDIRFKVPYIGELICDTDCPAVEDYNDFAEDLEDIWQQDGALLTYAAVLEAEKPETLRGACELLRNLDNYQRIVEGACGYGQQRLQETLGLDDEAIYELDGYMDFEKYGQDCMENDCVTKTEFGLLRRLEPPFPEQTQGQQMFQ